MFQFGVFPRLSLRRPQAKPGQLKGFRTGFKNVIKWNECHEEWFQWVYDEGKIQFCKDTITLN